MGSRASLVAVLAALLCPLISARAANAECPSRLPGRDRCIESLRDQPVPQQLRCLHQLPQHTGESADCQAAALATFIETSDGRTNDRVLAAALDALRRQPRAAAGAAERLGRLLAHAAPLYRDRDKLLTLRLRAHLFVLLTEIGLPVSALPMLVDLLAHVEDRSTAIELGAVVRAAGTLGLRGRDLAPYLLQRLEHPFAEQEFSLQRYELEFPRKEATTVQIEAIRALGRICTSDDREAKVVLAAVSAGGGGLDPRAVSAAQEALAAIEARTAVTQQVAP